MSTQKFLAYDGLEHLIALIKGAIEEAGGKVTADGVTISMDESGVISIKNLGVGTDQLADGSVTKEKLAEGAVDSTVIVDGSITSTQIADGAVTTEKLADGLVVPVAKGGTGATDAATARTNLGVTPANIGAAPSQHQHSASDITSGTLPVARGGTGVTTDDALFQKVVSSHYPDNDELLAYLGLS